MELSASPNHKTNQGRVLFLLVLVFQVAIFLYMVVRRLTPTHDGFQYFLMQYYFLNNAVTAGQIPQWMPFLTHGTVATWWYAVQAGLLQNVLCLLGPVLRPVNFVPLFHAGIFFDELLLLTGTWLLARRFLASIYSVFFVAVSVAGTCLWITQPWFDFHFYYALPLLIYWLHRFLDSGKWRYFLAAGNLLAIQTLGNLPYYLPMTTLIIFVYFFYVLGLNSQERMKLTGLRWGWKALISLAIVAVSLACAYFVLRVGTEDIVYLYHGRNRDGSVPLEYFMTYGGAIHPLMWLETLFGLSPYCDVALFAGFLTIPLAAAALFFNTTRKNAQFTSVFILIFVISSGALLTIFLYYLWPLMKYYRHIGLTGAIGKLFLCFLAGFGFDAVFFNLAGQTNSGMALRLKRFSAVCSVLLFVWGIFFLFTAFCPAWIVDYIIQLVGSADEFSGSFLFGHFLRAGITLMLFAAAFYLVSRGKLEKFRLPLILAVLLIHAVDVYAYQASFIKLRMWPLAAQQQYNVTRFQSMPFVARRSLDFWSDNPRAFAFFPGLEAAIKNYGNQILNGDDLVKKNIRSLEILRNSHYRLVNIWANDCFFFKDELGNSFRVDHWPQLLNQFLRACKHEDIDRDDRTSAVNKELSQKGGLAFLPLANQPCGKTAGFSADKIQFFSGAYASLSAGEIAKAIGNSNYTGDVLTILADGQGKAAVPLPGPEAVLPGSRLDIPYKIERFDANRLEITATVEGHPFAWMRYSDVWHPFWKATVNGIPAQIFNADLAYKAVLLKEGGNQICFYFGSPKMSAIYLFFSLNALIWLLILCGLVFKILFPFQKNNAEYANPRCLS